MVLQMFWFRYMYIYIPGGGGEGGRGDGEVYRMFRQTSGPFRDPFKSYMIPSARSSSLAFSAYCLFLCIFAINFFLKFFSPSLHNESP